MSVELVHLLCWTLLASMVVFLIVGGVRTFREFKEVLRERRAKRKGFARTPVNRRPGMALRFA